MSKQKFVKVGGDHGSAALTLKVHLPCPSSVILGVLVPTSISERCYRPT